MVEPDRQIDLDRIAAEEERVRQATEAQERVTREQRQAQGRLENPR